MKPKAGWIAGRLTGSAPESEAFLLAVDNYY